MYELHEDKSNLSEKVIDIHRAIASICEELEAADWYNQRSDASKDVELSAILKHNRNEEFTHAAMLIEWLRRSDEYFDMELRKFMFKSGEVQAEASE